MFDPLILGDLLFGVDAYSLKQRAATEARDDSVVTDSLTTESGTAEAPATRKTPKRIPTRERHRKTDRK